MKLLKGLTITVLLGTLVLSITEMNVEVKSKEVNQSHFTTHGKPNSLPHRTILQEIVDSETGVHYLIVMDKNGEDYAITPLYNADGTLKYNDKGDVDND